MKYTCVFYVALFLCNVVSAQEKVAENTAKTQFFETPYKDRNSGSFRKSYKLLSFAYGLPNLLAVETKTDPYQDRSWFGPVIIRAEFPVSEVIGIAPQVAFYSGKFTDYQGGTDKASVFDIGTMGMYHFNKLIPVPKLDVYAGLGLHLEISRIKWNVGKLKSNNLVTDGVTWQAGFLAVAGARYYVAPKLALFAEGGFPGGCYFDLGITFKLQ